jgi:hypothetical protein
MKRCPACNRVYQDESIRFCLDDGVALMGEQVSSSDPHQTLQIPSPRGTDPIPTEKIRVDATSLQPQSGGSKRRKSFVLMVAIAALSALALVVISYLYFSRHRSTSSQSPATTNTAPSPTPTPEGRWFIILGTFPKTDLNKANERLIFARHKGFDARLIDTDEYPNLKDGTWAVAMGPFRKENAQKLINDVRPVFSDAYVKSGW